MSTSVTDQLPGARQPRSPLVLAAATTIMTMLVLDSSIIGTMLPSISDNLRLSADGSAWVVSSYLLAIGVALPLMGPLVDRVGPGIAFTIGSLGFVAASTGIGLARGRSS